jgi:hypothetical protein
MACPVPQSMMLPGRFEPDGVMRRQDEGRNFRRWSRGRSRPTAAASCSVFPDSFFGGATGWPVGGRFGLGRWRPAGYEVRDPFFAPVASSVAMG